MALNDWFLSNEYKTGFIYRRRSDYRGIDADWFKPKKYGYQVKIREKDSYPLQNQIFKTKAGMKRFVIGYMKEN